MMAPIIRPSRSANVQLLLPWNPRILKGFAQKGCWKRILFRFEQVLFNKKPHQAKPRHWTHPPISAQFPAHTAIACCCSLCIHSTAGDTGNTRQCAGRCSSKRATLVSWSHLFRVNWPKGEQQRNQTSHSPSSNPQQSKPFSQFSPQKSVSIPASRTER
jgi:hypothetical protein